MPMPCEQCVHATTVPHSGLHCARSGGWYRCEDERALSWIAARAYHACGADGRFFAQRREVPGGERWTVPVAGTTVPAPPAP